MMLMQDHPSFSRLFCTMKKEEEQEARSRESLSTCVLKDLAGEVEPGSSPRFIGKTQETGKVTSFTARSQHLSVWWGDEASACGLDWNDWPQNMMAFHFHVPPMAHVKNSFHAS